MISASGSNGQDVTNPGVNGVNNTQSNQIQNWTSGFLNNMFAMLGLAAFAFVVKYVFNNMS